MLGSPAADAHVGWLTQDGELREPSQSLAMTTIAIEWRVAQRMALAGEVADVALGGLPLA